MTDLTWVQKAGRDQIKKKAQAIYNIFDEATDQLDIKDGEVLRLILMETINQLQESPGIIQAPILYLVAQCIAELDGNIKPAFTPEKIEMIQAPWSYVQSQQELEGWQ